MVIANWLGAACKIRLYLLWRCVVIVAAVTLVLSGSTHASASKIVDSSTLTGKFIVGYQGWFACPGDHGQGSGWTHWFAGRDPSVDMLPDVGEFDQRLKCLTPLADSSGLPVYVYSSERQDVLSRHFGWMRDYGIDGAAIMRFASHLTTEAAREPLDRVLSYAKKAAKDNGRIFYVCYDLSGLEEKDVHLLIEDWRRLEASGLTSSVGYAHHEKRPVLELWGLGFKDRPIHPAAAQMLIRNLRRVSDARGGLTLIGGVPSGWRTNQFDASSDMGWSSVYQLFQIISPWSVARFSDDNGADRFLMHNILPDIAETKRLGIAYMPVVFPGFSWHNLTLVHHADPPSPLNAIPRRCGTFLWHQAFNSVHAGVQMLFGAMFDEVDEGTALFKTLTDKSSSAANAQFVTLDADGCSLPSDWYLRESAQIARMLKSGSYRPVKLPLQMSLP